MKTGRPAKRYAKALFKLSLEEGRLDAVQQDLQVLAGWLEESAAFAAFVENPLIPPEKRSAVLDQLTGDGADPLTTRFLRFLDAKGRLSHLAGVCDVFESLSDTHHNVMRVEVTAAMPLTDEQIAEIRVRFSSRFGKEVRSTVYSDPSLLGGFKVRVQDTIYDYSIKAQLEAFRQQLINA